jgi:death-on-curing protein
VTFFLTLPQALRVVEAATGAGPRVRDLGLLESALARPATELFGEAAYGTFELKAAALLDSVVGNHALVDGNKRAGLALTAVFLAVNGEPLGLDQGAAYRLVMDVAAGAAGSLDQIARGLRG